MGENNIRMKRNVHLLRTRGWDSGYVPATQMMVYKFSNSCSTCCSVQCRRERQSQPSSTVTPPKPPNTSEVNQPYPMAPRKIKNTAWSAKYLKHLYQNANVDNKCTPTAGFRKLQQRPSGKRLFTEMTGDDDELADHFGNSPQQNCGVSIWKRYSLGITLYQVNGGIKFTIHQWMLYSFLWCDWWMSET